MDDRHLSVQVVDGLRDLSENAAGSQFSDLAIGQLPHVFSQTDATDVISDKEYLLGAVDQVMQVNYSRVLDSLKTSDLALAGLLLHGVLQLDLLVDLHSVLTLVTLVEAQAHLSVGPRADYFTDLVVVEGCCWFNVLAAD